MLLGSEKRLKSYCFKLCLTLSEIKKALKYLIFKLLRAFAMWYLQESNQGHMDFQSIALPTELRYLFNAGANIG